MSNWVPLAGTVSGKDAVRRFFENLVRNYTFEEVCPVIFVVATMRMRFALGSTRLT
jgi:hypothetical protein